MSKTKFSSSWRSNEGGQMTPALAREMLSTFKASKLSVAAFARKHSIPKNRVTYWQHRIVETDKLAAKQKTLPMRSSFAPVMATQILPRTAASSQLRQTLEVTLPSGSRIVVHGSWDASSMQSWLAAIEAKA